MSYTARRQGTIVASSELDKLKLELKYLRDEALRLRSEQTKVGNKISYINSQIISLTGGKPKSDKRIPVVKTCVKTPKPKRTSRRTTSKPRLTTSSRHSLSGLHKGYSARKIGAMRIGMIEE